MTTVPYGQPHPTEELEHAALAETVAGGPLTSEGPGSFHRVRNVVIGALAVVLLVMAMVISYSSAFGQPAPRHVALAVAGDAQAIVALGEQQDLDLTIVSSSQEAQDLVRSRDVDGAIVFPAPRQGPVLTYVASGGGRGVAQAVAGVGTAAAAQLKTTSTTTDLAPLSPKDPSGAVEFYVVLFLGLGSSLGATVFGRILGTVDTAVVLLERSAVLVGFSGLLAALITVWVDAYLQGLTDHPWALFGTLWLTALAMGGAVTGVAAVGGSIASLVVVLLLVVLGNSSSGGLAGVHMLNGFFQPLSTVFPQANGLDLLRSVQYFPDADSHAPLVRLVVWAVAGLALTGAAVLLRSRRERVQRHQAAHKHVAPSTAPLTRLVHVVGPSEQG